jgi:phosphatidylinositol phospholipase C delta
MISAGNVSKGLHNADLGYMMNYAMFQRNGKSGYILKPDALRVKDKVLIRKRTKHSLDITVSSS